MELNSKDCDKQGAPKVELSETSSSSQTSNVTEDLELFREKWQEEIRQTLKKQPLKSNCTKNENFDDSESMAKSLFLRGTEMEKAGKFYEAIQFYRRAVQIVPDIEFKIDNTVKVKKFVENHEEENNDSDNHAINDESEEEINEELLLHIQKKIVKGSGSPLCSPKNEQIAIHIGQIPVEIILHILRWVVSSDLDLRSLEMFGAVCRGFYLCARDPEIWRLACIRIWNLNCRSTPGIYKSWRQMYIEKPKLHFNGCYISKTTYIRPGEESFQDQLYRPWHLVAYYRFLRFFPEGKVLMLTSADEPSQCVGLLKSRNARYPILSGYYRLKDDKVTLVIQRHDRKVIQGFINKNRKKEVQSSSEQTFHMELKINSTSKKRHVQLIWMQYSIYTKNKIGDESNCTFDLRSNLFPPLWFSRVKSFTAESENPLL